MIYQTIKTVAIATANSIENFTMQIEFLYALYSSSDLTVYQKGVLNR